MRRSLLLLPFFSVFAGLVAVVPPEPTSAGVYHRAADYRRGRLSPAGEDATFSEKRNGVVVTRKNGSAKIKMLVPRDSVWGFVDDKRATWRLFRNDTYRLESGDTLSIYSLTYDPQTPVSARRYTPRQYFFSQGPEGNIFSLNERNLRTVYERQSSTFVSRLKELQGLTGSLSSYDKDGVFRVVQLYRESLPK